MNGGGEKGKGEIGSTKNTHRKRLRLTILCPFPLGPFLPLLTEIFLKKFRHPYDSNRVTFHYQESTQQASEKQDGYTLNKGSTGI